MLKPVVVICVVGGKMDVCIVNIVVSTLVVAAKVFASGTDSIVWASVSVNSVVISAAVDSLAETTVNSVGNVGSLIVADVVVEIATGTGNPIGIAL